MSLQTKYDPDTRDFWRRMHRKYGDYMRLKWPSMSPAHARDAAAEMMNNLSQLVNLLARQENDAAPSVEDRITFRDNMMYIAHVLFHHSLLSIFARYFGKEDAARLRHDITSLLNELYIMLENIPNTQPLMRLVDTVLQKLATDDVDREWSSRMDMRRRR